MPIIRWHRRNRISAKKKKKKENLFPKGRLKNQNTVVTRTWHVSYSCEQGNSGFLVKESEFSAQPIMGQPLILFSKIICSVYCPPLSWFYLLRVSPIILHGLIWAGWLGESPSRQTTCLVIDFLVSKFRNMWMTLIAEQLEVFVRQILGFLSVRVSL